MNIHIASRTKAKKLSFQLPQAQILSISDPMSQQPWFSGQATRRVGRWRFYDMDEHHPDGPQRQHMDEIIDWARKLPWPEGGDLIIHCEAGICRSSASALAVAALHEGTDGLLERFFRHNGIILPNMIMVQHFDDALELQGELVAVCEHFAELWDIKRGLKMPKFSVAPPHMT